MKEGESNAPTGKESGAESGDPGEGWRRSLRTTLHALTSGGWLANIITGLALAMLSPIIGEILKSRQMSIFGAAAGLTILIWTIAFIMARQSKPVVPEVAQQQSSDNGEKGEASSKQRPPVLELLQPLESKPTYWPTLSESVKEITVTVGGKSEKTTRYALRRGQVSLFPDVPLVLSSREKEIIFDTSVLGHKDRFPVSVERRRMVIASGRPSGWQINSSLQAYEIVDETETPVFQLYLKAPNSIVVTGIFPTSQGPLLVGEDSSSLAATPEQQAEFRLKRIFKYPSREFPGKYEEH